MSASLSFPFSHPSTKSRTQRIPHNQLLPLLEAAPQISNPLIQRRTKHTSHIAKHTLMLLHTQSLSQEPYDGRKSLIGAELEDALC
jgi:hypothetical protein